MSSLLIKSIMQKPLTFTARHQLLLRPPSASINAAAAPTIQLRTYYDNSSSSSSSPPKHQHHDDDRIFPVYIHHVSKIVLQHLQDSRPQWLIEQGLDKGLHIKSNGTFMLKFPSRVGFDGGKIWTSYDASTRQHWLSVYRRKFNGKFLLKTGRCKVPGKAKMEDNAHKVMSKANQTVEEQIRAAVDQMVRLVPPSINNNNSKP